MELRSVWDNYSGKKMYKLKAGDIVVNRCFYLLLLEGTIVYDDGEVAVPYQSISYLEAGERWKEGAAVLDTDKTFPGLWSPYREPKPRPEKKRQKVKYWRLIYES
jgi:hypothetical protein